MKIKYLLILTLLLMPLAIANLQINCVPLTLAVGGDTTCTVTQVAPASTLSVLRLQTNTLSNFQISSAEGLGGLALTSNIDANGRSAIFVLDTSAIDLTPTEVMRMVLRRTAAGDEQLTLNVVEFIDSNFGTVTIPNPSSGTLTMPSDPQPRCGDGTQDAGEACDLGAGNGACPATCSTSCTTNSCTGSCGAIGDACGRSCYSGATCGTINICSGGAYVGDGVACTTAGGAAGTCQTGSCQATLSTAYTCDSVLASNVNQNENNQIDSAPGTLPAGGGLGFDTLNRGMTRILVGTSAINAPTLETCDASGRVVEQYCLAAGASFTDDGAAIAALFRSVPIDCGNGFICQNGACVQSAQPRCGDGTQDAGEACDLGDANNGVCPSTCSSTCTTNTCGGGTACREGQAIADCGAGNCNAPLAEVTGICKCSDLNNQERHLINGVCSPILTQIKQQLETNPTADAPEDGANFFGKIAGIFRALRCYFNPALAGC
jgi:hypothetical protein